MSEARAGSTTTRKARKGRQRTTIDNPAHLPSAYFHRATVERKFAAFLALIYEEIAPIAARLERAQLAVKSGTLTPEALNAAIEAARLLSNREFEELDLEMAACAEILTGAKIVDPYSGDFVEPGEPYGSEAALEARNTLRLAEAEARAGR